ncbi:glycerol dehydratase reactivase beta/small subunit family protein [Mycolicibacterium houstonense]|uniref:glycerol dehydratase reactivase beta/small subunit family protein n=1 Tax=Mycolicibacterium houstonense TaxID=146021 RepID=UPI001F1AF413|nr:glycerol dehydratase reactivase beta/small subunit family protein [Mycolicibacterium houstonense]
MSVHSGGQPDRPAIVVLSAGSRAVERDVLAGIEEEGVPYLLAPGDAEVPAAELARRAALRSPLHVGVGVGTAGDVCVQHAKLSDPLPELCSGEGADAVAARVLGHNAARIVVGVPLKPDD